MSTGSRHAQQPAPGGKPYGPGSTAQHPFDISSGGEFGDNESSDDTTGIGNQNHKLLRDPATYHDESGDDEQGDDESGDDELGIDEAGDDESGDL
ncbi:hypothetical protein LTR95_018061 [Oleoguttula sp. CCFEE 5521]